MILSLFGRLMKIIRFTAITRCTSANAFGQGKYRNANLLFLPFWSFLNLEHFSSSPALFCYLLSIGRVLIKSYKTKLSFIMKIVVIIDGYGPYGVSWIQSPRTYSVQSRKAHPPLYKAYPIVFWQDGWENRTPICKFAFRKFHFKLYIECLFFFKKKIAVQSFFSFGT